MQKRTRRLLILGFVLILAVAVWQGWNALTDPDFLTPRVETALSDALDARCDVQGLNVSLLSGVTVDSVTVYPPEQDGEAGEPLVLNGIHLTHDLTDLILHSYRIESIEVQRVAATLSKSTLDWPLAKSLRDGISRVEEDQPAEAPPLPRVALHEGTIRLVLPGFQDPLVVDGLSLNLSDQAETGLMGAGHCQIGGTPLWLEVKRTEPDKPLQIDFTVPSLNLGALPLPRNEKARKFMAHLETSGMVRGNLSLAPSRFPEAGRPITGQIHFEGINAAHTGWGLGITNVTGQVQVGRHNLQAVGFSGLMNDAPFTIDTAELTVKDGKPHHAHLAGKVRHIDLGALPVESLPEDLRKPIKETGVSAGLGDVTFRIEMKPHGKPVRRVKIVTHQAEMKPIEVPLPIKNVDMEALWREKGRLDINRATARVYGGRVKMSGYFLDEDKDPDWEDKDEEDEAEEDGDDDDDDAIPHLTIQFEDVPATQKVLESMPEPEPAEIGRKLSLKGAVADGTVRIDGRDVKLRLLARADKMKSPEFPYPVENVAAQVEWSSERKKVFIHEFTARHGEGLFHGSAVANLRGDATLNLQMQGSRVPLDEHLQVVLPDETWKKWQSWGPRGHIDVNVSLRDRPMENETDGLEGVEAAVRLREVSLHRDELGEVARRLNGTVYLASEGYRVEDLTGVALGVPVHASGPVAPSLENSQLSVTSERVPFTSELIERWPETMAAPLRKLKPSGKFRIQAEDLGLVDGGTALSGKLTLTLDDTKLHLGKTPARVSGTARLDLKRGNSQTLSTSGTVHLDNLQLAGLKAKNLDTSLKFENSRLTVPEGSVQAYGGLLSVKDFTMESDGSEWKLNADIQHVEMESLIKGLGMEKPPTGVMLASLKLKGNGLEPVNITGHGDFKCERGNLYTFPFILSVLRIMDLRLPADVPATDAVGNFELENGIVHLEDLLLTGGSMPVHVQGTIGVFKPGEWDNQPVDIIFTLVKPDGLLDRIPIVNLVKSVTIDQLREHILQARVAGTVGDYQTSTVAEPLTAPVRALWGMLGRLAP